MSREGAEAVVARRETSPRGDLLERPCPPLGRIFDKLSSATVGLLRRRLYRRLLGLWGQVSGAGGAMSAVRETLDRGDNPFWRPSFRGREIFFPGLSVSILLEDDPDLPADPGEAMIERAARLVRATLEFRQRWLDGKLETDMEGRRPLDMATYDYLFSRTVVGTPESKGIRFEVRTLPPSEHVVLGIGGGLYRLDVLRDGRPVEIGEIRDGIRQALERARGAAGEAVGLGALTVLQTLKSAELLQTLRGSNEDSMADLDRALFFVALDEGESPEELDRVARRCHVDGYRNRDYRQSLQIVILGNGKAGVIPNHPAGIDGTIAASFCSWISQRSRDVAQAAEGEDGARLEARAEARGGHGGQAGSAARRLRLRPADTESWARQLEDVEKEVAEWIYPESSRTVFTLPGIGWKDLKELKVSPDAAGQCALHLAFSRCFDKEPTVSSFVNMRRFRTGRIHRFSPTSPEMLHFLRQPGRETLLAAVEEHRRRIREAKSGDDGFYSLLFLLSHERVRSVGPPLLLLLLRLFDRPAFEAIVRPDLLASNVATLPGTIFCGRPAVRLGFPPGRSLGGHYLFFADRVVLCFLSRGGLAGREEAFAEEVGRALEDIRDLLGETAP